jgi:hypothetical protein
MRHRIHSAGELFDLIRERPAMYVGRRDLELIKVFAYGFMFARERDPHWDDCRFGRFHDYVAEHFGWFESTAGWQHIICKESSDPDAAVDKFYVLFDSFRAAEPLCVMRTGRHPHHEATGAIKFRTQCADGTLTLGRSREVPDEIRLMRFWPTESCYMTYVYASGADDAGYYRNVDDAKQRARTEFNVQESDWES